MFNMILVQISIEFVVFKAELRTEFAFFVNETRFYFKVVNQIKF